MFRYIMKRVLYAALTVWLITTLTWFMMQAIPGDPFTNDKRVVPEIKEAFKRYYGLDKPLVVQYGIYMKNLLSGKMGMSFQYRSRSVNQIIANGFPVSAELGMRALAVGLSVGICLGIVAALRHNKGWDRVSILIAVIGVSVPNFVIGAFLQYFLGVKLRILPVAQWKGFEYTIMPTIALSFFMIAQIARYMRTSMLDVIGQDYIKTAKAKGLSQFEIIWRHQIRNAILPIITLLGPWIAFLITGTFVVETIFAIPGLGRFYVQSISMQDYTVITGLTAFLGTIMVTMNLLVDIIYVFVDPRIKLDS